MANSNRQTSNKAGVKSLAKKQDSTRHGFNVEPPARKVAGAFGKEDRVRAGAPADKALKTNSRPDKATREKPSARRRR